MGSVVRNIVNQTFQNSMQQLQCCKHISILQSTSVQATKCTWPAAPLWSLHAMKGKVHVNSMMYLNIKTTLT